MHHAGRWKSEPFSEATTQAALNCQKAAVKNDGHAHRGMEHPIVATTFLVELDDLHDSKRILLLIGLGNPAVL